MARGTVLQWMVARALCEGAPATRGRVAALMGVDVSAVYARSAAEDWTTLDWRAARLQALQREIVAVNAAERERGEGAWPPGGTAGAGAAMAGQDAAGAGPNAGQGGAPGATAGAGAAATPDTAGRADGAGGTDGGGVDESAGSEGVARTDGVDVIAGTNGSNGADGSAGIAGTGGAAGIDGIDAIDRELDGVAFVASAMPARAAVSAGPPSLDGADPVAVLAGASAFVARQVAALIDRAERVGGRLDRKQIDGLSAFARMMERWETLARERAQQEEVARDEDVAESLRLIDERILELALVEARRLVAAGLVGKDA